MSPQVVHHHACRFELGTYKKIPQTLGSSVGHGRSFYENLAQSARGLIDGPAFVDYIPHFWQVWVKRQQEGQNVRLGQAYKKVGLLSFVAVLCQWQVNFPISDNPVCRGGQSFLLLLIQRCSNRSR